LATKCNVMSIEQTLKVRLVGDFCHQILLPSKTAAILRDNDSNTFWKLEMLQDDGGFLCVKVSICDYARYEARYMPIYSEKQAFVDLRIRDADGTVVSGLVEMQHRRFETVKHGLLRRLIRLDTVDGDRQRYLTDGHLTVLFTIQYLTPESVATDQLQGLLSSVSPPPPDVVSCMQNALKEARFSDVVVEAGGQEFRAHRVIMAERSDVFRAMFESDMKENRDRRVVIDDLSADVVGDLLTFIYTDSAPNIKDLASELLMAAEKYNVPRLKAACEAELLRSLHVDNVVVRLTESDMVRSDELRDAALQFIVQHASEMVGTPSWELLWKDHPHHAKVACEMMAQKKNTVTASKKT